VPDEAGVGWVRDGGVFVSPPPTAVEEQTAAYDRAIRARLDAFAQARGYYDIASACSFSLSTNEQWRAEGQYAVEARDVTWAAFFDLINPARDGLQPLPILAEVMAALPELAWPESGD
jgi:hypothetical protein